MNSLASHVAYRLMRLRRLVVLSIAIPLIAVFVNYIFSGSVGIFALVCAVMIPLLHLLRYPSQWQETLNVSLSLFVLILTAGFAHRSGYIAWPIYSILLVFVGAGLFLKLTEMCEKLYLWGSRNPIRLSASQLSHLDVSSLYSSMMPMPNTEDEFGVYGAANDDGFFTSTLKPKPLPAHVPEVKLDKSITDLNYCLCKVISKSNDGFEVITVFPDANETCAATYAFEVKENGTLVTIEEYGLPLVWYIRCGVWLKDSIGDSLTGKIELAEGLSNRSIKMQPFKMLIVDIAWFFPHGQDDPK
jgi:hypothetical protein